MHCWSGLAGAVAPRLLPRTQVTNVASQCCVLDDRHNENVRLQLEKCSVSQDLDVFIAENATGSEHPKEILYRSYYTRTLDGAAVADAGAGGADPGAVAQSAPSDHSQEGSEPWSLKVASAGFTLTLVQIAARRLGVPRTCLLTGPTESL